MHALADVHTQEGVLPAGHKHLKFTAPFFSCYLSLPPKRVARLISSKPQGVITQGVITYECGMRTHARTHTLETSWWTSRLRRTLCTVVLPNQYAAGVWLL